MEEARKGTVTSLASLFPVEEAQKASKRMQDAITEKENELGRLRDFITDNNNLINLVQKLPEELNHDIMVPFGKAAFFPGRLIHTNEFLVLLGEGYFAERTSKQTIDILKRRGNTLDSQVDALEAMIKDLKAEASFFNVTASEAAEGLVEIREDYVEEKSIKGESKPGDITHDPPSFYEANEGKAATDDEEFARMMAKLDELEEEELAAESDNKSDNNEEAAADIEAISHQRLNNSLQDTEDFQPRIPLEHTNNKSTTMKLPEKYNRQEDITDQLNFAGLAVQSKVREGKNLAHNVEDFTLGKNPPSHPEAKEKAEAAAPSKSEAQHQTSRPSFDSHKAFTGSIVEHTENLQTTSAKQTSNSSQVSGSQPSKPVSRFKMQRR
ncbi:hypothetical protein L6164_018697 [Bauhinia variegata]|uniref:Uncharacterized protein n=1 Tax=Bauhinia variegata TaxID=167791 RepID=A0ACB9NE15_BAUVA|nr:hypothetical protein L6164_018697 [Bauhinia variegata]